MNKEMSLQRQLIKITNENEILRSKTRKIHQIEGYVNILIQNNQKNQQEISKLSFENCHLKNQIQIILQEKQQLSSLFQKQVKGLRFNHENDSQKMSNQIKSILNQNQKKQILFLRQKQQIIFRANTKIQHLTLQIQQIKKQNETNTQKLERTIFQQLQYIQQNSKQISKIKKNHLALITQSQNQKCYILNEKNKLQKDNILLNQEIDKKTKILQQFQGIKNQLIRQLQITQSQKNRQSQSFLFQLQNLNKKLLNSESCNKKLQIYVSQLQQNIKKNSQQSLLQNQQIQQWKEKCRQSQKNLKQMQSKINSLNAKFQSEYQDFQRMKKRYNQQFSRATQQNQILHQKLKKEKNFNQTKTLQIQDLIKVIDKLQINASGFQEKIIKLLNQNASLNQEINKFTSLLNQLNLQNKLFQQKISNLHQKNLNLEQKLKQNSFKIMSLQEQKECKIKELNNIHLQFLVQKQKQITKFKSQIDAITQKVLNQKRELIQNHRLEKQQIVKQYEIALKTKDQQFKKRFNLLEEQIILMRVRH